MIDIFSCGIYLLENCFALTRNSEIYRNSKRLAMWQCAFASTKLIHCLYSTPFSETSFRHQYKILNLESIWAMYIELIKTTFVFSTGNLSFSLTWYNFQIFIQRIICIETNTINFSYVCFSSGITGHISYVIKVINFSFLSLINIEYCLKNLKRDI